MPLSDLLLKMAEGHLSASELNELKIQATQVGQVSDLVSSWVVPGTAIPFIRNLQAENISIPSGEIRMGTGNPGNGFSGVRIAYPAVTYGSDSWNIAGVNNDALQVGLRASDGKFLGAAGALTIDATAMTLKAQTSKAFFILWASDDDSSIVGKIGAFYAGGDDGIEVVGKTKTGNTPVAHLMTENLTGTFLTGIEVRGTGEMQFDLRTGTIDTVGNQKVRIMTNVNSTANVNTVLYLESGSKGTAANGFGTAIAFLAENAAGNNVTIAYIAAVYTDVTAGSEDSKVVAGYLVNGVSTEKQLAP